MATIDVIVWLATSVCWYLAGVYTGRKAELRRLIDMIDQQDLER